LGRQSARVEIEVEGLEGGDGREAGQLQAFLKRVRLAAGYLVLDEEPEEFDIAELVRFGLVDALVEVVGHAGEPESLQVPDKIVFEHKILRNTRIAARYGTETI
jgi:hypothetical protein